MHKLTFLFFLFFVAVPALGNSADKVAVVVALDANAPVNTAVTEFYRAVNGFIAKQQIWQVAPSTSVMRNIPSKHRIKNLGSIAAFDRRQLIKAHSSAKTSRNIKDPKRNRVIKPLQAMLDTLVLDGAVIADCLKKGSKYVRSCSLYFYRRSEGRIVAAAKKPFTVAIRDAKKWAGPLVMRLREGMQRAEATRNQELIEELVNDSATETPAQDRMALQLAYELSMRPVSVLFSERFNAPVLGVGLSSPAGVTYLSGSVFSASSGDIKLSGKAFTAGADLFYELSSMTRLGLGFSARYAQEIVEVNRSQSNVEALELEVQALQAVLAAGIRWLVFGRVYLGGDVLWRHPIDHSLSANADTYEKGENQLGVHPKVSLMVTL